MASPVSYAFRRFVEDRIHTDASDAILKVTPIVTLNELYDGFGVSAEDKETLMRADERSWMRHLTTYQLRLDGFGIIRDVPVEIRASFPRQYGHITPNNIFAPIFKFTQEWSILHYVTSEVIQLVSRNAVPVVFPWLNDIIKEEDFNYEKDANNRKFFQLNNIRNSAEKQRFRTCMLAFRQKPKNIPVVPTSLREAIALGNKLYTQHRLLKDRPNRMVPDDSVRIQTKLSTDYIPQYLKDAVDEMRQFQTDLHHKLLYALNDYDD